MPSTSSRRTWSSCRNPADGILRSCGTAIAATSAQVMSQNAAVTTWTCNIRTSRMLPSALGMALSAAACTLATLRLLLGGVHDAAPLSPDEAGDHAHRARAEQEHREE